MTSTPWLTGSTPLCHKSGDTVVNLVDARVRKSPLTDMT